MCLAAVPRTGEAAAYAHDDDGVEPLRWGILSKQRYTNAINKPNYAKFEYVFAALTSTHAFF